MDRFVTINRERAVVSLARYLEELEDTWLPLFEALREDLKRVAEEQFKKAYDKFYSVPRDTLGLLPYGHSYDEFPSIHNKITEAQYHLSLYEMISTETIDVLEKVAVYIRNTETGKAQELLKLEYESFKARSELVIEPFVPLVASNEIVQIQVAQVAKPWYRRIVVFLTLKEFQMKKILLIVCLAGLAVLAACGPSSKEIAQAEAQARVAQEAHVAAVKAEAAKTATFQTVEEQRQQGRANAALVASDYQRQNPRILGYDAIVKADTAHSGKCPQGDGWAEVVFMKQADEKDAKGKTQYDKATVMCSTVSFSEGCVMVSPVNNWDKHPKKSMDGQCGVESEVPMPLPKVVAQKL